MIGVYDYTVILTYLSAAAAMCGMGLAMSGHTDAAVFLVAFCGILDMFDGAVARTKINRTVEEKRFGIQIDSLCDVVAFGVLPAVIGFCLRPGFSWEKLVFVLQPLCGIIRLAYFNVQEEKRQDKTQEKRKYYLGLPITTSAIGFPLITIFHGVMGDRAYYVCYVCMAGLLAVLYLLKLRIHKPGKKLLIIFSAAAVLLFGWLIVRFFIL